MVVSEEDGREVARLAGHLAEVTGIVGARVDGHGGSIPHDPRIRPLQLADPRIRGEDADDAHQSGST